MKPPPTNEPPPTGHEPEGGETHRTDDDGTLPDLRLEGKTPRPQSTKPPFCWASKLALLRIASDPQIRGKQFCLLVYQALYWTASDARASTFTTSLPALVTKCGVSVRSIQYALHELRRLNLVVIVHKMEGGKNLPSTFTLLDVSSPRRKAKSGAGDAPGVVQDMHQGWCTGEASSGADLEKNLSPEGEGEIKENKRRPRTSLRSRSPGGGAARGARAGRSDSSSTSSVPQGFEGLEEAWVNCGGGRG
jgi:hypothetical protein